MKGIQEHPRTTTEAQSFGDLDTPVGEMRVVGGPAGLTAIYFQAGANRRAPDPAWRPDAAALQPALAQLREYFAGQRQHFDLPLAPRGTPFQQAVWAALRAIPYGATITYAQLATRLGRPTAVRAVGAANGANPLPIVVPCHRVIGSDGRLVGYGGGLEAKAWLLALERGSGLARGALGP